MLFLFPVFKCYYNIFLKAKNLLELISTDKLGYLTNVTNSIQQKLNTSNTYTLNTSIAMSNIITTMQKQDKLPADNILYYPILSYK